MNDAQIWTLIGGFFAIITFMSALLLRIVDTKIEALGNRLEGKIDRVEGVLGAKIDNLDKDVSAITQHLWGTPPQQQQ